MNFVFLLFLILQAYRKGKKFFYILMFNRKCNFIMSKKNASANVNKVDGTKTAQSNKEVKTSAPKVARNIYATDYGKNVLQVNKALKSEVRTLGGALDVLRTLVGKTDASGAHLVPHNVAKFLKVARQHENYEKLKAVVKPNKISSAYSPFVILQAINKHLLK